MSRAEKCDYCDARVKMTFSNTDRELLQVCPACFASLGKNEGVSKMWRVVSRKKRALRAQIKSVKTS